LMSKDVYSYFFVSDYSAIILPKIKTTG